MQSRQTLPALSKVSAGMGQLLLPIPNFAKILVGSLPVCKTQLRCATIRYRTALIELAVSMVNSVKQAITGPANY